jgi:hypothetical protein
MKNNITGNYKWGDELATRQIRLQVNDMYSIMQICITVLTNT